VILLVDDDDVLDLREALGCGRRLRLGLVMDRVLLRLRLVLRGRAALRGEQRKGTRDECEHRPLTTA
jgi:hypothetical protein